MNHLVAPSLLSADFANIQQAVQMLNKSEADWFHLDVMDGCFVPNISFGIPVIKAIKKHALKPLDVHLMIVDPGRYIKAFKDAGADILSIHYEACDHLHRNIQSIKAEGMQAGVAINPHTSVSLLEDVLADIDLVCMMSVNPGFGGQKFIPNTLNKIEALREMADKLNPKLKIEIDGGVTEANYREILSKGADVLVAGSTVFGSSDPIKTISQLKVS
jgi:ribulose-phosphate 3-epimerase